MKKRKLSGLWSLVLRISHNASYSRKSKCLDDEPTNKGSLAMAHVHPLILLLPCYIRVYIQCPVAVEKSRWSPPELIITTPE